MQKELKAPLIDVRLYLKSAGDLDQLISDDGIHLTSKGYQCMSESIFKELQKHFQEQNYTSTMLSREMITQKANPLGLCFLFWNLSRLNGSKTLSSRF